MKHPEKGILTLKSAKHVISDAWGKPKKSNFYVITNRLFSSLVRCFVFIILFGNTDGFRR